ncbi:hypothetical protein [uncultured Mediterranean phage uvMED]|nr:hypothetical protein [uncultured Mediterranean phage uvMED]
MSRIVQYQSSFTMGEFDPLVKGRVDITQYQNALEKATNIVCIPQGAIERRPGTQFLLDITSHLGSGITAQQGIRLIPFEFSTTDSFMLVFVKISTGSSNNTRMFVFNNGTLVTNINGSGNNYLTLTFGNISFDKVSFTQSADTLIIVNEDLAPLKIERGATNTAWTATTITLTSPKFAFNLNTTTPSGTITPSSIDGTSDVTASTHVFHSGESDTAQAGGTNTITLHSGASSNDDIYNGSTIKITGGTGSGQTRIISDYVHSTKVATVSENWTTQPDNTSTFTITSMVGQYVQVINGFGRAKIIEITSSTKVKTNVEVPFYNTSAQSNYELEFGYEDVFSTDRGFPRSAVFHEGRLYFGGTKSLPSALIGSKISDFFNFLESEGLDDDAIFALLSSDTVNAITGLRSGRDLQIFTTGNEWYVQQAESEPITPQNLTLKAATKSGSKENIMPVAAEGGTIFLQRSGKALREFLFSDVELSYQSNNISLLSSHLLKSPVKITFRRATSTDDGDLLIIVNGTDGTMAAYSIHRTQKVVAPSEFITDGTFEDCSVDINDIYVIVKRTINSSTKYYVELLDDDRTTDASFQLFDGSNDGSKPTSTTVSNLTHLEGETVEVIRDDIFLGTKTVSSGQITIDQIPTTYVEVGLHYDVLAKTLPAEPRLSSGTMVGRKKRIVDASPILFQTQNIAINGKEVPLKQFPYTLDSAETVFSGRKRVTPILGFSTEVQIEITQTKPLFFTLLGLEYNVSGSQ